MYAIRLKKVTISPSGRDRREAKVDARKPQAGDWEYHDKALSLAVE